MKIEKKCVICGATTEMEIEDEKLARIDSGEKIADVLPESNLFEREFLISGMCYKCQEKTFNTPMPGNEEVFGEELGSCIICDTVIYEKQNAYGEDKYKCPCCGQVHIMTEDGLEIEEEDEEEE